jgi:hypothetical protein
VSSRFGRYKEHVDDLAEHLAIRDRFRRKLARAVPFDERVRRLLDSAGAPVLIQSPAGREHFIRHNFRLRAVGGPPERAHLGG